MPHENLQWIHTLDALVGQGQYKLVVCDPLIGFFERHEDRIIDRWNAVLASPPFHEESGVYDVAKSGIIYTDFAPIDDGASFGRQAFWRSCRLGENESNSCADGGQQGYSCDPSISVAPSHHLLLDNQGSKFVKREHANLLYPSGVKDS
jgi:hypothetical protein